MWAYVQWCVHTQRMFREVIRSIFLIKLLATYAGRYFRDFQVFGTLANLIFTNFSPIIIKFYCKIQILKFYFRIFSSIREIRKKKTSRKFLLLQHTS